MEILSVPVCATKKSAFQGNKKFGFLKVTKSLDGDVLHPIIWRRLVSQKRSELISELRIQTDREEIAVWINVKIFHKTAKNGLY